MVGLRAALFPGHFGASDLSDEGIQYYVGHTLDAALVALHEQMRRGLLFACTHGGSGDCEGVRATARAPGRRAQFAARLPAVRALLGSDARAAYEGDPAATQPGRGGALLPRPDRHHPPPHRARALRAWACRSSRASWPSSPTAPPASTSTPARAIGGELLHRSRHRRRHRRDLASSASACALPGRHPGRQELPHRRRGAAHQGHPPPPDRRGRRRHLRRRHHPRPRHHRPRLQHRRQRLAHPQRRAGQPAQPGPAPARAVRRRVGDSRGLRTA